MSISTEYLGAVVILIASVLKMFGIEMESDAIQGLILGAVALFVAVRRKMRGDIDVLGRKA